EVDMARAPSPHGKRSLVRALFVALFALSLSSAATLADAPDQASPPVPAAPAVDTPKLDTPKLDTPTAVAKPTPAERGDAQNYLDARDGYSEAQGLYKDHEYAHALAVLDETIATLNWVITHAADTSARRSISSARRRLSRAASTHPSRPTRRRWPRTPPKRRRSPPRTTSACRSGSTSTPVADAARSRCGSRAPACTWSG